MIREIILSVCLLFMLFCSVYSQDIESLDAAKAVSVQSEKPILLEFGRSDCEYCQKVDRESENEEVFSQALERVVYYTVNVLEDYGPELKEAYNVGNTYPVFILTDSKGEIINRWTGYSTAGQFVVRLNGALKDLRTVKQRRADFEAAPSLQQAVNLGNFYSEIDDHLAAIEFYRKAEELSGERNINLSYDTFRNAANAAWKELASLDIVYPEAERVLASGQNNNIIKMATIMGRLARKFDNADSLAKYLDAGIKAAQAGGAKDNENQFLLVAEHALQITHDTMKAIGIKEMSLGENWETIPDRFYDYVKWCLERKINLGQAEYFGRKALNVCPAGEHRAMVANTLAEVYAARGNYQGAIDAEKIAIENHPENSYYNDQLESFQDMLKKENSPQSQ